MAAMRPSNRRGAWVRAIERIHAFGLVLALAFLGGGVFADDGNVVAACLTHCPPLLLIVPALVGLVVAIVLAAWRAVAVGVVTTWLTLFPLGGCALGSAGPQASHELAIVSYNVEKWTHSGAALGQLMAQVKPDVFCLQEAGSYAWVPQMSAQLAAFQAKVSGYEVIWADEVAIGSRLPILGRNVVPLPLGPKSRPMLEVVVAAFGGTPVSVLSVHLVYTGHFARSFSGLTAAAQARRAQAIRVVDYARTLTRPVILCGDLNADFRSAAVAQLATHFRDAWQERGFGLGFTLPAGLASRRIDYVFARNLEVTRTEVLAATASDHAPLWSIVSPLPSSP